MGRQKRWAWFALATALFALAFAVWAQSVSVRATQRGALVSDANNNGVADEGDIVEYQVIVANCGSETAQAVKFRTQLQDFLSLVQGSVIVGVPENANLPDCFVPTTGDPAPPPPPAPTLPVAVNDTFFTFVDTVLNEPATGVLSNDTLNGATIASFDAVSLQGGAVVLNPNGSFDYTPPLGFDGVDSFTYTLSNADGTSTATATVNVFPAPDAVNDNATAILNTTLNVPATGVLANDTVNGATITAFDAASVQGGTVVVNADGSFSYTPPTGYLGADSFTYTLANPVGSDTATVNVQVDPPGPVDAVDDSYNAVLDTALNVPALTGVLANDAVNGATITAFDAVGTPLGGTITLNPDGSFTYTPPASTVGVDTFTYTLDNGITNDTATVTITIQLPGAPIPVNDNYTTPFNTVLNVPATGVLGNDSLFLGTITAFDDPSTGGGTVVLNGDGSFTYTPLATFTGNDTFTYTLTNGAGSNTATVTITVGTIPTAVDDTYNTLINTPLNVPAVGILVNDTVQAGTITAPTTTVNGGALTVNGDGSFTYTPPSPTFTGNDTFTYTLTNGNGTSAPATVTIEVRQAPTAVNDGTYIVSTGGTLTIVTADPVDLLDNDTLGAPLATLTSFGGGSLGGTVTTNAAGASVALAGGTLTVNADGSFTLATPTTQGTYTFQYRLANVAGSSDATVTIEVRQSPVAEDDAFNVLLTNPLNGDLTANNGSGADSLGTPAYNTLTFGGGSLGGTITTNSAPATVSVGGGTNNLTINLDGTFTLNTTGMTAGVYTFQYRLSNVIPASDDATVTIEVRQAPTAVNDGTYTVGTGGTLTILTTDPIDLLDNDTLGFPLATIASFGGGSAGGTVASTSAGTPDTTLPGFTNGSLTVNADGSFTLTPPTLPTPFCGNFTFEYALTNTAGTSTATVTVEVQCPPNAVDDTVGGASVPGDNFHTPFNATLTVTDGSAQDLDANDTLGVPAGSIASFGAIQTVLQDGSGTFNAPVGTVTTNAAGATVTVLNPSIGANGSLTVNADGSFTFVPPQDYTGLFRFQYRLTNAVGSDDAVVTLAVGTRPAAVTDTYPVNLVGNVGIDTATSSNFSVLTNDAGDNTTVSLSASPNGDFAFNGDGSGRFAFNPTAGYNGTAGVTYNLFNGFGTVTGTLNLPVSGIIWFVNATADAGSDGRLGSAFETLAQAALVDSSGHNIFVYSGSYTCGITLENNEQLLGQGMALTLAAATGYTFPADAVGIPTTAGTNPTLTSTAADCLTLAQNNTIRGVTIGNTDTFAGIVGMGYGTLTIADTTINGSGQILTLNNGTLNATFDALASTSSDATSSALTIQNTTVTGFSSTSVNIQNAASSGIDLTTNTGTLDFGNITINTTAGIGITSNNGGTLNAGTVSLTSAGASSLTPSIRIIRHPNTKSVTFGATTIDKGVFNGNAVELADGVAQDAAVTFASLAMTTSNGGGLIGDEQRGAVTVTTGAAVSTAGGPAINLRRATGNTLIDLNFTTVSVSNSPSFGIRLQGVGGTGLNITGNTTLGMGAGSQQGILLSTISTGTYNFSTVGSVAVNNRRSTGILMENVAGTFGFGATTINNIISANAPALRIATSAAATTFASLTANMGGTGVGTADTFGGALPTNTGTGDAVQIESNTARVTINGGALTNMLDDGIDIRTSTGGLTLNGVTITGAYNATTGGAFGIQSINNSGGSFDFTNVNISNYDNDGASPSGAAVYLYYNAGGNTVTFTGGTLEGRAGGGANSAVAQGVVVFRPNTASGTNTLNMTNVTFNDFFAGALTVTANAGTTVTNVQAANFTQAPPSGRNGTELFHPTGSTALSTFNVNNSQFTNAASAASRYMWVNINAGTATVSLTNNANTQTVAADSGRAIVVDLGNGANATLTITGNAFSNLLNQGLLVTGFDSWTGTANITFSVNTFTDVGQSTTPATASGVFFDQKGQSSSTMTVLMQNNTISVTNGLTSAFASAFRFRNLPSAPDTPRLNITAVNNTFSTNGTYSFRGQDDTGAITCFDVRGSNFSGDTAELLIDAGTTFSIYEDATNTVFPLPNVGTGAKTPIPINTCPKP